MFYGLCDWFEPDDKFDPSVIKFCCDETWSEVILNGGELQKDENEEKTSVENEEKKEEEKADEEKEADGENKA